MKKKTQLSPPPLSPPPRRVRQSPRLQLSPPSPLPPCINRIPNPTISVDFQNSHISVSLSSEGKGMGNYVSCTLANAALLKSSSSRAAVARVLFPSGELRQFREPVKAAELMLESPNSFLVNARALHVGRRFSALGADEDLEFGSLYAVFPMKRVNSIVTAADMAVLFLAANSAAKRISGSKVRILPEELPPPPPPPSDVVEASRPGLDENESEAFPASEFSRQRLSLCRSRKPLLETIREEGVCSS